MINEMDEIFVNSIHTVGQEMKDTDKKEGYIYEKS